MSEFDRGPTSTLDCCAEINVHLRVQGLLVTNGTIVDATIIQAPSSTRNSTGERDPAMHWL